MTRPGARAEAPPAGRPVAPAGAQTGIAPPGAHTSVAPAGAQANASPAGGQANASPAGAVHPGPLRRLAAGAARAHDLLTEAGLALAMAALAAITAAYAYEVAARYFFGAPTRWSADLVSYLLLFAVFTAMPAVTASGAHVAVTVLLERLPPRGQAAALRLIALTGAVVCAWLGWIAAEETLRQHARGVTMMAAVPTPKWLISVWIVYGFAGSALHFLRLTLHAPGAAR